MMPTPQRRRFRLIVAGVDFSRESAKALKYAAATSRACGGRIVVVYAIDPLLTAAAARAYSERLLIADGRRTLAHFVRRAIGDGVVAPRDLIVVAASARQALADVCRRYRADVLVLGTHGRGGFSKMVFGSTTEALLRRYHGAVMVVPPHCGDPGPHWPDASIVAAVGEGRQRRAMLAAAARVVDVFGGGLTVIAPSARVARPPQQGAPLVVLPLPDAARLRTFRQGTAAYEIVRTVGMPVLVVRTGRRIGHVETPRRAA